MLKHGENKESSVTWLPPPYICKGSQCFCCHVITETVSKLAGTKLQRTVVKKPPTFHLIWTISTISIKQGNKSLGPNVTENAVQRLSHTESPPASILGNLDNSIKWLLQSGKHGNGSLGEDLDELIKWTIKFNIFTSLGGIFLVWGRTISPLQLEKAGKLLIHFVKMFAAYNG